MHESNCDWVVVLLLLLTACQNKDDNASSLEDLLSAFENHQLTLKEVLTNNDHIFGMKLNGVKPSSYE